MLDADPQRWLDTALLDIPEARIREVEITSASGPSYKIGREKKEDADFTVTGVPKGRELSTPSMASTIARELTGLTLSDVRKTAGARHAPVWVRSCAAKAPASSASPKAVFRTFDGLEVQLQGREDGERRYITASFAVHGQGNGGRVDEAGGSCQGSGV